MFDDESGIFDRISIGKRCRFQAIELLTQIYRFSGTNLAS